MKIAIVVLLASAFAPGAVAQNVQHAPSLEQCKADISLWYSQLEDKDRSVVLKSLRHSELRARTEYVIDCYASHDEMNEVLQWKALSVKQNFMLEQADRMIDFLARHKLWAQFLDEDSNGLR